MRMKLEGLVPGGHFLYQYEMPIQGALAYFYEGIDVGGM